MSIRMPVAASAAGRRTPDQIRRDQDREALMRARKERWNAAKRHARKAVAA
jgi:hypothetical protein